MLRWFFIHLCSSFPRTDHRIKISWLCLWVGFRVNRNLGWTRKEERADLHARLVSSSIRKPAFLLKISGYTQPRCTLIFPDRVKGTRRANGRFSRDKRIRNRLLLNQKQRLIRRNPRHFNHNLPSWRLDAWSINYDGTYINWDETFRSLFIRFLIIDGHLLLRSGRDCYADDYDTQVFDSFYFTTDLLTFLLCRELRGDLLSMRRKTYLKTLIAIPGNLKMLL